jgi:TolB protein
MLRRTHQILGIPVIAGALLLAACVLALVGTQGPADAAFPGENGRIAFAGSRVFHVSPEGHTTEALEVITVSPDGTGTKQLTRASNSADPEFSPDGAKIAFSGPPSIDDRFSDIFVMARSGEGKKPLTDTDDRNELDPAWSPDGTRIAFLTEQPFGTQPDLWVMDADGSGKRRITDDAAYENGITWTPDGARIAFEKDGDIWTVAPDGTGPRNLTGTPDAAEVSPDFSPDGEKLAFAGNLDNGDREIFTMNLDGGALTNVTDDNAHEDEPAWSPDGRKIAFRKNLVSSGITNGEIFKKNADGTGRLKNVSKDPGFDQSPDWGPRPTASG